MLGHLRQTAQLVVHLYVNNVCFFLFWEGFDFFYLFISKKKKRVSPAPIDTHRFIKSSKELDVRLKELRGLLESFEI